MNKLLLAIKCIEVNFSPDLAELLTAACKPKAEKSDLAFLATSKLAAIRYDFDSAYLCCLGSVVFLASLITHHFVHFI